MSTASYYPLLALRLACLQGCASLLALVIAFLLLLGTAVWWGHPAGITATIALTGILLALVFRAAAMLASLLVVASDACASGARVGCRACRVRRGTKMQACCCMHCGCMHTQDGCC
jgi:hypothetical protein